MINICIWIAKYFLLMPFTILWIVIWPIFNKMMERDWNESDYWCAISSFSWLSWDICWSCRSVYRRQDVCVAKVILWILSSCTYWWENRYPYPPLLHDGTTSIVGWWPPYPYLVDDPPTHTWLMTPLPILGWWPPPIVCWLPPTHTWLMTPLPILGWWPPHIVGWWPPLPILACWPPPPHGWMMCWVKLV